MPRRDPAADQGGAGGQADRLLRDPVPRRRPHLDRQLRQRLLVGARADDDALAAGAVDRLEHQLVEGLQHPLDGVPLVEPVGLGVGQHRLLAQVVADQVGHPGVEQLVVGDPVADRVGDGHPAGARGVEHAGAADHRVRPEVHRVEELVVDAAVDDVDALLAVRRPHADLVAGADQVAALDQLDAHLAGQQRVLEVGGVVDAGGEDDDRRVGDVRRRGRLQRGQQPARVVVDRLDAVVGEQLRQHLAHRRPVGDDVADARRRAQVVLEHPEVAGLVAHQVDAARRARGRRWAAPARAPARWKCALVVTTLRGTIRSANTWPAP